jgi:hypothetical protein
MKKILEIEEIDSASFADLAELRKIIDNKKGAYLVKNQVCFCDGYHNINWLDTPDSLMITEHLTDVSKTEMQCRLFISTDPAKLQKAINDFLKEKQSTIGKVRYDSVYNTAIGLVEHSVIIFYSSGAKE